MKDTYPTKGILGALLNLAQTAWRRPEKARMTNPSGQRSECPSPSPSCVFVSHVSEEAIVKGLEALYGRRLLDSERAAVEEGFRPQGLLDENDAYAFRAASPRYRGRGAARVQVDSLALDHYGRFDDEPVELAEIAYLDFEEGGIASPTLEVQ